MLACSSYSCLGLIPSLRCPFAYQAFIVVLLDGVVILRRLMLIFCRSLLILLPSGDRHWHG
jgi:hypothetical protein